MSTQTGYGQDVEVKMRRLFATMLEKDRRRYAAIAAAKLASSSINAISSLFGLCRVAMARKPMPTCR